jgi:NosR/NirI family nitrous oxide reductase transcriptional regulator
MRHGFHLLLLTAAIAITTAGAGGQSPVEAKLTGQLRRLFPTAGSFSPKQTNPPHYKAYADLPASGSPAVLGVAFWTTELEPLERGYDGPIKILVGLDMSGILSGIVVAEHHEPYGYFSVDTPQFAAEFKGKDIREPLTLGRDIDLISRATISVSSATRAIRNGARRVARQLLTPPQSR